MDCNTSKLCSVFLAACLLLASFGCLVLILICLIYCNWWSCCWIMEGFSSNFESKGMWLLWMNCNDWKRVVVVWGGGGGEDLAVGGSWLQKLKLIIRDFNSNESVRAPLFFHTISTSVIWNVSMWLSKMTNATASKQKTNKTHKNPATLLFDQALAQELILN